MKVYSACPPSVRPTPSRRSAERPRVVQKIAPTISVRSSSGLLWSHRERDRQRPRPNRLGTRVPSPSSGESGRVALDEGVRGLQLAGDDGHRRISSGRRGWRGLAGPRQLQWRLRRDPLAIATRRPTDRLGRAAVARDVVVRRLRTAPHGTSAPVQYDLVEIHHLSPPFRLYSSSGSASLSSTCRGGASEVRERLRGRGQRARRRSSQRKPSGVSSATIRPGWDRDGRITLGFAMVMGRQDDRRVVGSVDLSSMKAGRRACCAGQAGGQLEAAGGQARRESARAIATFCCMPRLAAQPGRLPASR
jgi:hypothetical protein